MYIYIYINIYKDMYIYVYIYIVCMYRYVLAIRRKQPAGVKRSPFYIFVR